MRLADRHVRWLRERATNEGLSLSEVLRQLLDQHVPKAQRGRPPTAKERKEFDQVFAAYGLVRRQHRKRRR